MATSGDVFRRDDDLDEELRPMKCYYCSNRFTGSTKEETRKRLHDHIERKHQRISVVE